MKTFFLLSTLVISLSLTACEKPTVVNVPTNPVIVPGPAGPSGPTGAQGPTGSTEIIVVTPPASAASN